MRKNKTTKTTAKKTTTPQKTKTASDIFSEYLEITQEKTKVILEICEMMHLKAAFENEIVLSKREHLAFVPPLQAITMVLPVFRGSKHSILQTGFQISHLEHFIELFVSTGNIYLYA